MRFGECGLSGEGAAAAVGHRGDGTEVMRAAAAIQCNKRTEFMVGRGDGALTAPLRSWNDATDHDVLSGGVEVHCEITSAGVLLRVLAFPGVPAVHNDVNNGDKVHALRGGGSLLLDNEVDVFLGIYYVELARQLRFSVLVEFDQR